MVMNVKKLSCCTDVPMESCFDKRRHFEISLVSPKGLNIISQTIKISN